MKGQGKTVEGPGKTVGGRLKAVTTYCALLSHLADSGRGSELEHQVRKHLVIDEAVILLTLSLHHY